MQPLKNNTIKLRALELEDLDFLFQVENDQEFWEVSGTQTPFSKHILKQYLANAQQDIYEAKQLRMLIEDGSGNSIGLIDLFDFDPQNKKAGLGILILKKFQKKGFGKQAIRLFLSYAFESLDLHQIYANITIDNIKSIALFESLNFKQIGIQKDWIKVGSIYKDVALYQIINK